MEGLISLLEVSSNPESGNSEDQHRVLGNLELLVIKSAGTDLFPPKGPTLRSKSPHP